MRNADTISRIKLGHRLNIDRYGTRSNSFIISCPHAPATNRHPRRHANCTISDYDDLFYTCV